MLPPRTSYACPHGTFAWADPTPKAAPLCQFDRPGPLADPASQPVYGLGSGDNETTSAGADVSASAAIARISSVIFIEQNFGPHMLQK